MKSSVALCYLTHNHPDVIQEVFENALDEYRSHGIDVFIYDDSDDDKTKELTVEYMAKGYENLYYVDAHGLVNGDHKYLVVIKGAGLPKEYDYIWPCKDRVWFSGNFLDKLCEGMDEGNDVVFGLSEDSRWETLSCVYKAYYTDAGEFYRKYASFSTNWECLIRKRETMLDPIDWDFYREKYGVDENCNFNQTLTLYIRISEMDSFKAKICRFGENDRMISEKAFSAWNQKLFELWIDKWVSANFRLPSIYDKYKAAAIKSETNHPELFGALDRLMTFRMEGRLTPEIYEKYKDVWHFVTDIDPACIEMIAKGDDTGAVLNIINDFENSIKEHKFGRAWWLLASNNWLEQHYGKEKFAVLSYYFWLYRNQTLIDGDSKVFDGVNSIDDILKRVIRQG